MDWKSIAGLVGPFAPTIGTVLGTVIAGPIGARIGGSIGGIAGEALAAAFGVEPTPEAVQDAITKDPNAAEKLQNLETEKGQEILAAAQVEIKRLEEETAQTRIAADDTANARAASAQAMAAGSNVQWAPAIITVVIFIGFIALSVLAMMPSLTTDKTIVFYLLSAWQSLATLGAGYWLGSSVSSKNKDASLASLTSQMIAKPNPSPAVMDAIKNVASKRK